MPYMKTPLSDALEEDVIALNTLAEALKRWARDLERRRMKLLELETRRQEKATEPARPAA